MTPDNGSDSRVRTAKMAVCPRDGAPLISTMAFSGAEFYCLECGAHLGWMSPRGVESTPEVEARYESLLAEWDEHAGRKLLIRGWYGDCDRCSSHREYHTEHATDEERAAHAAAMTWLKERADR